MTMPEHPSKSSMVYKDDPHSHHRTGEYGRAIRYVRYVKMPKLLKLEIYDLPESGYG